jgi:hypothetical protein
MHEEKTKLLMALWQSFLASATDEKKNQIKQKRIDKKVLATVRE